MTLLLLGLILWAGLHLFPGLAPDARAALIQRVGLGAYKGLFALGIVAALLLIIVLVGYFAFRRLKRALTRPMPTPKRPKNGSRLRDRWRI
mgnify:CR=1 FL=1